MNSWHMETRTSVSARENAKRSPERSVIPANNNRYETELRIAAYTTITDLLAEKALIRKDEERKIRKRISLLKDSLIRPNDENPHTHDRDLSAL